MFVYYLCTLSSVLAAVTSQAFQQCISPLINGDVYRTSDKYFSSSSNKILFPPKHARINSGGAWCSEILENIDSPWLQVEFGANVTLKSLQVAGLDRVGTQLDEFVLSYRLQYKLPGGDLQYVTDITGLPMIFNRSEDSSSQSATLPHPVDLSLLRIVIVPGAWSGDRACLRLEAYGCTVDHSCSENPASLSTDRNLLPLESVSASSAALTSPVPNSVDLSTSEWCTHESVTESGPYVQLDFTEPVTLTHMRAHGDSIRLAWVTNFTVSYIRDEEFHIYQGKTDFTAANSDWMIFTFWEPITAQSIRFTIVSGQYTIINPAVCWQTELFGCQDAAEQQVNEIPTSVTTSTPSQLGPAVSDQFPMSSLETSTVSTPTINVSTTMTTLSMLRSSRVQSLTATDPIHTTVSPAMVSHNLQLMSRVQQQPPTPVETSIADRTPSSVLGSLSSGTIETFIACIVLLGIWVLLLVVLSTAITLYWKRRKNKCKGRNENESDTEFKGVRNHYYSVPSSNIYRHSDVYNHLRQEIRGIPQLHSTENAYDVIGTVPSHYDTVYPSAFKLSTSSPSVSRPASYYTDSYHIYSELETSMCQEGKANEDNYMELNQLYSVSLPNLLYTTSID